MSRFYRDNYDALPEPVREILYEEPIDYSRDDAEWRPIYGHPGYYVSRHGEVLSIDSKNRYRYLRFYHNKYGHCYVDLSHNGKKTKCLVHRLVAEAFIPNPQHYPIVMHKDDDPTNNEVTNLCWGTAADNLHDCMNKGRFFTKPVYCYETGETFNSCAEAADAFGVSRSLISVACAGEAHSSCGGLHLCYLEDAEEKCRNAEWYLRRGTYKPVKAIRALTGETLYFASRKDASETLGVSDSGISSVLSGRIKHSGGWIFENCSYREVMENGQTH